MDEESLESMVQDKSPEQEMLVVQEQELPQTDPEPEMGAAAAAAYDIPPPLLRQSPSPAPSETATDNGGSVLLSPSVLAQMVEMFRQAMSGDMQQMKSGIDENAQQIKEEMKAEMKEMRGEMQQIGQCLQAGIKAIVCSETRTAGDKMATPHAGKSELGGSATAVRPPVAAGEDRVIRETCWARRVEVTETVTVTEREKLMGVTETCTSETRREVTELTETREIEERLHGKDRVEEDARTHTQR